MKDEERGSERRGSRPDLVLIDGGMGQVNVVVEIHGRHWASDDIPVVGVAKGAGPRPRGARGLPPARRPRSHACRRNSAVLFYLQRLRDEAHRFAIGTHRAKRAKSLTTSTLDEVPGIGPNRKRALLMHFGTAQGGEGGRARRPRESAGHQQARRRDSFTTISIRADEESTRRPSFARFAATANMGRSFA